MNHWAFVIAAYAIVLGGTAILLLAGLAAMRKAEARAEEVTRK